MRSIAVTGATSMIGAALIQEAVNSGVSVLAFARKNSKNLSRIPDSELVTVIDCGLDELENFSSDTSCDVFYHFAWQSTDRNGRSDPVLQQQNIKFTLDAVKLAKKLGCKKFIGAGSQAEYGRKNCVISAETPAFPETCYGISKYAAGKLSRKLCDDLGMTHIWTRIFSVYGRNINEGSMVRYAVDKFRSGETAEFSAGTHMWNFLHEKDAGVIFYRLGEMINENRLYCVANSTSKPLRDYIAEMAEAMGEGFKYHLAEKNDDNVFALNADVSDLERDISYTPQVDFAAGIADMIASL